jgi:Domain of unknown function (DUF4082)
MVGPAAAPPTTFNMGVTSPGGSSGTFTGITGSKFTLAQTGKLTSLSIHWNGAGITFLLGLYADNAGAPGVLLASSTTATATSGWNTLSIANGPTLLTGNYWIVVQNQTGISGNYDATGFGAWNNGFTWTGVLPSPFPVASSGAFQYSMYATFNVAARSQLFLTSETPAGTGSPSGPLDAGIALYVTKACNCIGLRFWKRSGDPDTSHTVNLWDEAAGTSLGTASSVNEPASGFIDVFFSSPVALTAQKAYYVTAFFPSGYYNYTNNYFASAVSRGPITGYADGTVPGSLTDTGVYNFASVPTFPNTSFAANYWCDIIVDTVLNPFTLGPTSQGSSSGVYTPITGVQVTLTQPGSLMSMSVFSGSAGTPLFIGMYTDAGGVPGTLIASSALFTSVVGLQTAPIPSQPFLTPGTYWCAVQYQQFASSYTGYLNTPAGLGAYSACPWDGVAMAATWPSGSSTGSYQYSIYATLGN